MGVVIYGIHIEHAVDTASVRCKQHVDIMSVIHVIPKNCNLHRYGHHSSACISVAFSR